MENKKERILIVSASIGTGHTQAAKAIEECWATKYPDAQITHVDFLDTNTFSFDNLLKETYIKMIDVFPMLYDVIYRLSQGNRKGSAMQTALAWLLKRRMLKLIKREEPDVVIFTHPFPCGAACILKRQNLIDVPLIAAITDFEAHQFWVYDQVDAYFVGCDRMVGELYDAGIPTSKITVTGIPVRRSFFEPRVTTYNAEEQVTALIMGGGLGLGCVETALRRLDEVRGIDQIVVVTGRNSELYEGLVAMQNRMHKPTTVYGYTLDIPKLMQEATVLVTKPGGLTCMEAITVGLPMVFFSAIPGQEESNAAYLEEQGFACWARDVYSLEDVVTDLIDNPERLHKMAELERKWHIDGASNIVDAAHRLLRERESVEFVGPQATVSPSSGIL